jgi:CBS domain-containing protein
VGARKLSVTVAPSDSPDAAARLMLDEQIHRLIVVDVGIITTLDFVRLVVAEGVSA